MGSVQSLPTKSKLVVGCVANISAYLTYRYSACAVKSVAMGMLLASSMVVYLRRQSMIMPSANKVVFVTGCDSGLGFSFALYAHRLGFTVIAGCLQPDGVGAQQLHNKCQERLRIVKLDVANFTSVQTAVQKIHDILNEDHTYELTALINNAGVMIFGEFEWLTEQHILNQVNINLCGTMRITKVLCPLLRKHKGRIITISSHCALATLPGLAVYGATKAGLAAWCDGLRIEQEKYGVPVITFIPGSFVQHSNIMARQREYSREMEEAMVHDDKEFYGDYFRRFNQHLSGLSVAKPPVPIHDKKLHTKFEKALLSCYPYSHYEHGPFRYQFYHLLFKISPTWIRDYLVKRFMQMPTW